MRSQRVIIVGGGHAGLEAAWAASSVLASAGAADASVTLVTMDAGKIGAMSCNPAIGGLAKGQMVREIDALGGLMGRVADATGIQFRVLNASKGAAVRGPRAQCDRHHYQAETQRLLATRAAAAVPINVIEGLVERIETQSGEFIGVWLAAGARVVTVDLAADEANERAVAAMLRGERGETVAAHMPLGNGARRDVLAAGDGGATLLRGGACVLTTGTFMRALMHTGETRSPGGRVGEGSAVGISGALTALGFELGRLKTGTPPRLVRDSIDWESLTPQWGDASPMPFSALTPTSEDGAMTLRFPQVECRETATSGAIHALVRDNLHRAPMYAGAMEAETGPRYCPSLEDKVVRFAERESHHVFLEPESLATDDIYCNGISTSLPAEVQAAIIRGMPGCERAVARRWGYAVEYDMVWPHQIDSTAESKLVRGFFLAGQINGTSGYEEAAAQGLIAGLNAARCALGEQQVRLGREEAYLGVLMDDLVTRQPREPYRMFTSRAEHRLLLRCDNAEDRLTSLGVSLGLVDAARAARVESHAADLGALRQTLARTVAPTRFGSGKRLEDVARRPEITADDMDRILSESPHPTPARSTPRGMNALLERAITDIRYEAYLPRQRTELRRAHEAESVAIPRDLDLREISGLCAEASDVLSRMRPATLGQASRLAGVSPSDISILEVTLRRRRGSSRSS